MEEILEKVRMIISDQLDLDPDDVQSDTVLKDLQADSLDLVEITMSVEDEFGIEVPSDDAENFATVEDILNYIEDKLS